MSELIMEFDPRYFDWAVEPTKKPTKKEREDAKKAMSAIRKRDRKYRSKQGGNSQNVDG